MDRESMEERDGLLTAKAEPGLHGVPGVRADIFLASVWPELSRSRLQRLVKQGKVTRNGATFRASEPVAARDTFVAELPPPEQKESLEPVEMPLTVIFEDAHLLVLNKPPGLVVHPGAGTNDATLVHGLLHHCNDLSGIGGVERPGIVHRLDKETSGVLVVAKNDSAHRSLSAQFAARRVRKVYLAVVKGRPKWSHGEIDAPIGRHPVHRQKMAVVSSDKGRAAFTGWRLIVSDGTMSLLECHPRTGRTHQIRVHLRHIGHPILGDPLYGQRGEWSRHLLHAWKLSLRHPATNEEMEFVAGIPADFPLLPQQSP